ncbi:MAG: hypothetical protein K8S20_13020 [Chloroflexi bacterium]|nr:hypothetical protein [Chloroflexota bacterium]
MKKKMLKPVFLLFLGLLLVLGAVVTVVQPAAAQQQCDPNKETCCYDVQGMPIQCPNKNKKTPTPQRRTLPTATSTPTLVPSLTPTMVAPEPYPYPYPQPYPYPYPGGIVPLDPPVLICVFCDKPWLWGIGTGVIFVIVLAGLLLYLRWRPIRIPPVGPGPDPAAVGDGELLPAVQKIREAANLPGGMNKPPTPNLPGDQSDGGPL